MLIHVHCISKGWILAIACALPMMVSAQTGPSLLRAYPAVALDMCLSGWVELDYLVGVDGRVSDVRVIESAPPGVFDRVATSTYKMFVFTPAVINGQPTAERRRQRIEYDLVDGC